MGGGIETPRGGDTAAHPPLGLWRPGAIAFVMAVPGRFRHFLVVSGSYLQQLEVATSDENEMMIVLYNSCCQVVGKSNQKEFQDVLRSVSKKNVHRVAPSWFHEGLKLASKAAVWGLVSHGNTYCG